MMTATGSRYRYIAVPEPKQLLLHESQESQTVSPPEVSSKVFLFLGFSIRTNSRVFFGKNVDSEGKCTSDTFVHVA